MTYLVQIRIPHQNAASTADAAAAVSRMLGKLGTVVHAKNEIPAPSIATLRQEVQTYKKRLDTLQRSMQLIAQDWHEASPYARQVTRLHYKSRLTENDAALIEQLEAFAARAPLLARMRRFLIQIPDDPALEELAFRQRLVLANLDMPTLAEHPDKIDGAALHAFEEYHALYTQLFMQRFRAREASARAFVAAHPELLRQVAVIRALDTIPALGAARGAVLAAELTRLHRELVPSGLSDAEIRQMLRQEPCIRAISLLTPLPDDDIARVRDSIAQALQEKIRGITDAGVLLLFRDKKTASATKLSRLANLTQLHEITRLFSEKTTPVLLAEIHDLLAQNDTPQTKKTTRSSARPRRS